MESYTKIERLTYFGLIKACEIKFAYMKEWSNSGCRTRIVPHRFAVRYSYRSHGEILIFLSIS